MKIALCSSFVPFINGGYRNIVEWLERLLEEHGHQVERVYLPQLDSPTLLFQQMMAYRWVDLDSADRVICFRPPAHMIRHPHKIVWFIHHIRVFYDLWNTPYRDFPEDEAHLAIRDVLRSTDSGGLNEAKKIFTNSKVVSQRLKTFNNMPSEVLYPPVFQPERFHCAGFNDEIVYICRMEHHKRQHLLVEAMRYTKTPVKLRLCGLSSNANYLKDINQLLVDYNLTDRVLVNHEWISEEDKVSHLASCLAAAYLPLDEDSYGYPSIEASHAKKPILTTVDSGGVLELVSDGINGYVSEASPEALADAMDKLYCNRKKTIEMGQQAHLRLSELNVSWSHVLNRLLA